MKISRVLGKMVMTSYTAPSIINDQFLLHVALFVFGALFSFYVKVFSVKESSNKIEMSLILAFTNGQIK